MSDDDEELEAFTAWLANRGGRQATEEAEPAPEPGPRRPAPDASQGSSGISRARVPSFGDLVAEQLLRPSGEVWRDLRNRNPYA